MESHAGHYVLIFSDPSKMAKQKHQEKPLSRFNYRRLVAVGKELIATAGYTW